MRIVFMTLCALLSLTTGCAQVERENSEAAINARLIEYDRQIAANELANFIYSQIEETISRNSRALLSTMDISEKQRDTALSIAKKYFNRDYFVNELSPRFAEYLTAEQSRLLLEGYGTAGLGKPAGLLDEIDAVYYEFEFQERAQEIGLTEELQAIAFDLMVLHNEKVSRLVGTEIQKADPDFYK